MTQATRVVINGFSRCGAAHKKPISSLLNSSGHTHHYRCLAYPLARMHAWLVEICDWLHLHITRLAPATFSPVSLAQRSALPANVIRLLPPRGCAVHLNFSPMVRLLHDNISCQVELCPNCPNHCQDDTPCCLPVMLQNASSATTYHIQTAPHLGISRVSPTCPQSSSSLV